MKYVKAITNINIAAAFNAPLKRINEKIERPAFRDMLANNGYVLVTVEDKRESLGRRGKLYYVETVTN